MFLQGNVCAQYVQNCTLVSNKRTVLVLIHAQTLEVKPLP